MGQCKGQHSLTWAFKTPFIKTDRLNKTQLSKGYATFENGHRQEPKEPIYPLNKSLAYQKEQVTIKDTLASSMPSEVEDSEIWLQMI
jgi:hypothetical protein